MKLWSDSLVNGEPIPERHALGRLLADGGVAYSDNLSPHLAWSDLPSGTRSLALVCHDFDVPAPGAIVSANARELPADLARADFFHWLLVDLPTSVTQLREGEFSCGLTARGKPGPASLHGSRQGLNDYTQWFAADAKLAGTYFGYDGPFPPPNDPLVHHCLFTLYALSVDRLGVAGAFTGEQVRQALAGCVLGAATLSGTYTLNPRLSGR